MEIEVVRLDSSMPPTVIKFHTPPNFQTITEKIEQLSLVRPTKLFYLDEEGDIISITTDVELVSAYLTKPLRLFFNSAGDLPNVTEIQNQSPSQPSQTQDPPQQPLNEEPKIEAVAPVTQISEEPAEFNVETKDEKFEREIDESLGRVVSQFYDGDLQAKFIKFFEEAKNWALSLPTEFQSWRSSLVWVLEKIASVVRNCGYTAEILIRSIGWTLEEFSSFVLDRMKRDLSMLGNVPSTAPLPDTETNSGTPSDSTLTDDFVEVQKKQDLEDDAALQDLGKLEDMGWTDKQENIKKLQKHKGDLVACVEEYLTEWEKPSN